ncbi:MAG TPA: SRPBCC domain-containing protein [Methanoregulaceae archaeon]|nr:SRPBCC domain-containing protein [Methanoregulaceae archaeon]
MTILSTEIEIHAPAERVWAILSDFEAYPTWNPFIRQIGGPLKVGASLDAELQPPGSRGMHIRPVVQTVEPNRELSWLGRLFGIPHIFDGRHAFFIEPLSVDGVRFVQQETFKGLLVPLAGGLLSATERGFEAMNRALRERAEHEAVREGGPETASAGA